MKSIKLKLLAAMPAAELALSILAICTSIIWR